MFFLERKVNMVRIWLLTKEDTWMHPIESPSDSPRMTFHMSAEMKKQKKESIPWNGRWPFRRRTEERAGEKIVFG